VSGWSDSEDVTAGCCIGRQQRDESLRKQLEVNLLHREPIVEEWLVELEHQDDLCAGPHCILGMLQLSSFLFSSASMLLCDGELIWFSSTGNLLLPSVIIYNQKAKCRSSDT
jgi:hypothetical protein